MSGVPLVLAIDTSLDACAAALVRGDDTLAALAEPMQRGQAERLAPMVRDMLATAKARFADLDIIAVTTGPGSFTGVRVGLSFARSLALALQRPCIGVSTLEALALAGEDRGLRAAAIETPGASYAALFENGAPLLEPRPCLPGEWEALFEAHSGGRAVSTVGPGVLADVVELARRAPRLDPGAYPPNPTYLRAPHVTPPPRAT